MKVTITDRLSDLEKIKLLQGESFRKSMFDMTNKFIEIIDYNELNKEELHSKIIGYLKIFAYIRVYSKRNNYQIDSINKSLADIDILNNLELEVKTLNLKFKDLYYDELENNSIKEFEMEFDGFSYYNFEEDSIQNIKDLINELIKEINNTEELNDRYKKDFIEKLKKIYNDLDNNANDIGAFWSLMADAQYIYYNVVLNKTELLKKLSKIIKLGFRAQQTLQELNGENIINLLNEFEDK